MDAIQSISLGIIDAAVMFYQSTLFSVIKFIFGIYAAVLLVDIILLLVQRGLSGDIKDTLLGMNIPPELVQKKKKSALKIRWEKIRERMEGDKESGWKVAIIEADNIIGDLIGKMGYGGDNFGERLENVKPGQIDNLEDLKKAHMMRNRIVHEEKMKLTRKEASETMSAYEEFLRVFEVLD